MCIEVDGQWNEWGNWSKCSVSCGNGTMSRLRVCDDPAPDNGGKECDGVHIEYNECAMNHCRGKQLQSN